MRLKCELCTSEIKKYELDNPGHYLIKSVSGVGCIEIENGTEVNLIISPRELQDKFSKEARRILCDGV